MLNANTIFASCVVDNPDPPKPFIFALVSSLLLVVILTSLSWAIHKTVSSHASLFPWSKVIAVITSIMIGVFGSFGMQQYHESIFGTFGSELPTDIYFLVKYNYLLWMPTLFIFVLLSAYNKSSNQLLYFRISLTFNSILWILILISLLLLQIRLC